MQDTQSGKRKQINKPDMKYLNLGVIILLIFIFGNSCKDMNQTENKNIYDSMMIRIAEIEID